jgi:hypothetical protein
VGQKPGANSVVARADLRSIVILDNRKSLGSEPSLGLRYSRRGWKDMVDVTRKHYEMSSARWFVRLSLAAYMSVGEGPRHRVSVARVPPDSM